MPKSSPNQDLKPIIMTTGDPCGIGMDIVLVLTQTPPDVPVVILACQRALAARAKMLGIAQNYQVLGVHYQDLIRQDLTQNPKDFDLACGYYLIHIDTKPVVAGQMDTAHAPMVLAQLELAHALCFSGVARAVVTAPIHKSVMADGDICLPDGSPFMGHTEFFAQKCGASVVMMLASPTMRVALATCHIPLKSVPSALSIDGLVETVRVIDTALGRPNIIVCGLNPHAGEGGHLGDEELAIINPAMKKARRLGILTTDALPADTVFCAHDGDDDNDDKANDKRVILAMYHDQGLAPLKAMGFGQSVNITLGLPYVRTSVDHGTAMALAGTGRARADSLFFALQCALDMTKGNKTKDRHAPA